MPYPRPVQGGLHIGDLVHDIWKMEITVGSVYRSLGDHPLDRIGAGIMDKSGVTVDQREVRAPTWSIVHVLRGTGRYIDARGRTFALAPGWCFQRVPHVPQSTYLDPRSGWLEGFIDLGPRLHLPLADMRVLPTDPPAWRWEGQVGFADRLLAFRRDLEVADEGSLPGLLTRGLALALEPFAAARPEVTRDPIDEACRLLAEESERRIDLASWCRARGLDYERFRKEFTRRTGLPPHRYRIRRRIDRACALLRDGRSVQDVAAALGYPSPFEFSAQFRAHLGVPPSRWRAG